MFNLKIGSRVLAVAALALSLAGCVKGDEPCNDKTPTQEAPAMQAYASSKGYAMTSTPEGIYYEIINGGSGATPTPTSKVFVTYTGKLISTDAVFDSQTDHTKTGWTLNGLIPGWQLALPLIKKGGQLRVIIPSSLAYGCNGYLSIPGNAVLFFELTLVDVQ